MTAEAREVVVRPAREEDAPAIARYISMAESEMVRHFTGLTDPEESREALLRFILSPVENRYSLTHNLVAEIDGEVAGSAMSFPADKQPELDKPLVEEMKRRGFEAEKLTLEGEPGTYYLSTMGVDKTFRGLGIGSKLMETCMEQGKALGFEYVSLLVSKDKPRAQSLYERIGFSSAEPVSIAGNEYIRMRKRLR